MVTSLSDGDTNEYTAIIIQKKNPFEINVKLRSQSVMLKIESTCLIDGGSSAISPRCNRKIFIYFIVHSFLIMVLHILRTVIIPDFLLTLSVGVSVWFKFNGSLSAKWDVRPPYSNVYAMSDNAIANANPFCI